MSAPVSCTKCTAEHDTTVRRSLISQTAKPMRIRADDHGPRRYYSLPEKVGVGPDGLCATCRGKS